MHRGGGARYAHGGNVNRNINRNVNRNVNRAAYGYRGGYGYRPEITKRPLGTHETVHNLGGLMRHGETGDGPIAQRSYDPC
jgi:hypothetical protein